MFNIKSTIHKILIIASILIFGTTVTFGATQPGSYDSRDWNSGAFEPGGGWGTTEGMRVIPYRIDSSIKPGRKVLKKKAAWEYIGNIKERLLSGNYTGEILLRTKTDPKYNTLSDGIIYNTNGGRNYYVDRKDGKHTIMLDAPGGREEIVVTEGNYAKFENAMHDDNDSPYVFFDQDGNEAAIVFVEWHTRVKQKFNKNGEVVIILKGAPAARHRYK